MEEKLQELKDRIVNGTKVYIRDHDYTNYSGDAKVENVTEEGFTFRRKRPIGNQGRSFSTMDFTWEKEGGDELHVEGDTLHYYVMAKSTTSRSTAGKLRLCKSYVFDFPVAR